MHQFQPNFSTW